MLFILENLSGYLLLFTGVFKVYFSLLCNGKGKMKYEYFHLVKQNVSNLLTVL